MSSDGSWWRRTWTKMCSARSFSTRLAAVAEILSPWRPQRLRRIAAVHLGLAPFQQGGHQEPHYYLLRTYYGGGADHDAKLRGWLDENENEFEPTHEWFAVLDGAALFDVGDAGWQEAYHVFPELAGPYPDRRFTEEDVEWARTRVEWLIEKDADEYEEETEHWMDAIRQVASSHGAPPWLKGYPVKETEVQVEGGMLSDFWMRSDRGMTFEGYWEAAYVSKRYRIRGKTMRKLLPLVKGESADATGV
ncbi:hypothetical protein N658DRAFT_489449 [Parathielavia hyrcaniae]|uniref:Uncharacterized protein n=1 Tax=Parathielavia hyrcaniae TaxID=113614 RepID=A0AAN6SXY8_9PEZI|nr:hypothetical protein N658DRAFT_489449 [Parathielavia hyrcaniae]